MSEHVHWIIQENQREERELAELVRAVEECGQRVHLIPPLRGVAVPNIPDLPEGGPVVCHGPAFVPRALRYTHLAHGLFFDPEVFRWSNFRERWPGHMLSAKASLLPLSAVLDWFSVSGRQAFIRPDHDSKVFEGAVYNAASCQSTVLGALPASDLPVVVATPVAIEAEWRFFIVARQIVACSEYRRWGRFSTTGSVPQAAIQRALALAAQWSPAEVYCLDLAQSADRLGIVEANCFNASRFYGCNIQPIVSAVSRLKLGAV